MIRAFNIPDWKKAMDKLRKDMNSFDFNKPIYEYSFMLFVEPPSKEISIENASRILNDSCLENVFSQ